METKKSFKYSKVCIIESNSQIAIGAITSDIKVSSHTSDTIEDIIVLAKKLGI